MKYEIVEKCEGKLPIHIVSNRSFNELELLAEDLEYAINNIYAIANLEYEIEKRNLAEKKIANKEAYDQAMASAALMDKETSEKDYRRVMDFVAKADLASAEEVEKAFREGFDKGSECDFENGESEGGSWNSSNARKVVEP